MADDKLREQFAADQQAAATDDAAVKSMLMLGATGSPVVARGTRMSKLDQNVYDRFIRFLCDDPDAQFCSHVGPGQQLFWYLSPGCPLACAACMAGWLTEHVAGTDENTRCDFCGGPLAEQEHVRGVIVVPLVYRGQVAPGQPPPVTTVTYWACLDCAAQAVP